MGLGNQSMKSALEEPQQLNGLLAELIEMKSKINLGGLYKVLFIGGIIGLYIIPAVGLIIYMTGKILGIIPR